MRKVMVVDDDRDVRELLEDYFASVGYAVHSVPNGLKLIRALRVDRPDVIVLDVMMSWVNGFDLCRGLKRNPELSDIPVVFISARDTPSDIRRGLDCGAADYVPKPFDPEELHRRIDAVLRPTLATVG